MDRPVSSTDRAGARAIEGRARGDRGLVPWDGQTLEWLSASPPAVGNFAEAVATVRSAQPLLDRKEKGDR